MEYVPAPNPLVTSLPMLSTAAIPLNRNNACASIHVYTYIDVAQNDDDNYNDDLSHYLFGIIIIIIMILIMIIIII
jgi:hypothetical protein